MARKPTPAKQAAAAPPGRTAVTAERFVRLYKLLRFVSARPRTRAQLTRHLRLDVRGFYRDLEVIRSADIEIALAGGRYTLGGKVEDALVRLPFPDPHLTLGEVRLLAKGRTRAHRYLKGQIERMMA
jgi:hypothetical protein